MIRRTEIDWKSTDEVKPSINDRILVLLPHMSPFDRNDDWMEIRQCRVHRNGWQLMTEDGPLDWAIEDVMWWAWLPDWMERPGWRVT